MNKNRERYLERKKKKPPFSGKIVSGEKDNMGWFTFFMVLSFIGSIMFFVVNVYKVDVSNFGLFRLFAIAGALGFLIPIKIYRKRWTMSFYEYVIFNIISFAPSGIVILFILNLTFKSSPYTETYPISSFEPFKRKYVFHLDEEQYEDEEYLRVIYDQDFPNIKGTSEYSIKFSNGYFGLRVIEEKSTH
ncbi:MAG: hypothetical protein ACJARP_001121 [Vicingaceae bacterium]|jgi:hypothetical protein